MYVSGVGKKAKTSRRNDDHETYERERRGTKNDKVIGKASRSGGTLTRELGKAL